MRGLHSDERLGSTHVATEAELEEAGLFVQFPHSVYMGHAYGRPVYFSNAAGITINAGARSGKFRDIIARNLLAGTALHTIFMLDPKGEGAAVSRDQTADRKYCAYWNALALHGVPQDSMNFLGHLTIDSPTLVPDLKVLWENLLPKGKGSDSDYFVPRGQQFGEALSLAIIELTGVLTFPTLYEAINLVMSESEEWLDFAFHMSRSRFESVRAVEAEIAASRKDSGNGFRGIMGELFKSVACLSDPLLMASVSPPFTLDLKDIVESDQAWQVYLMAPAEFLQAWSAVIKSAFVAVMLLKSRAPAARRITFLIDECGQLVSGSGGGFGLVPRLFSYGAGVGCQPIIVTQSHQQMDDLAPGAKDLILSSAGASLMFAMRGDWESCQDCSRRLGNRTVEYDDALAQERAVHARNQALQSLIQGGDPLQAGMALAHQGFEMGHQTKQARPLQTPDELMNMPSDRAWLFHEDVPYPIEIERRPYWDTPGLMFHPNPYHPPLDRVTVMTRWGRRTRRVITEPVPERFAHYPQYRDGMWSRIGR